MCIITTVKSMNITDKKNQHYIPKLYLRFFSFENNRNQIGFYNFKNKIFKSRIPLKHQASGDFFYGQDGKLEDWLNTVENFSTPVLKKIIETDSIAELGDQSDILLFFIFLLANRTKGFAEYLQEEADVMFDNFLAYDKRLKDVPKDLKIKLNNPAQIGIDSALKHFPSLLDLESKLIVNNTLIPFVCSDSPVVKYNQYLEKRNHKSSHVGLPCKGLQLFVPLSPRHLVLYYDGWAYRVGDKQKSTIKINDVKDVARLNYLQAVNCEQQIFFNHELREKEISSMIVEASQFRSIERKHLKSYGTINELDRNLRLHSYKENLSVKLELSFITETKKAKKHVLSDYVLQLRDESIRRQDVSNYMRLSRLTPLT